MAGYIERESYSWTEVTPLTYPLSSNTRIYSAKLAGPNYHSNHVLPAIKGSKVSNNILAIAAAACDQCYV